MRIRDLARSIVREVHRDSGDGIAELVAHENDEILGKSRTVIARLIVARNNGQVRRMRPTTAFSVRVTLTLPSEAVTVIVALGTVGVVYTVEAWPLVAVVAVGGLNEPPTPPSLKVTGAPATTFPDEFFAVTTIGFGNGEPTVPVCLAPDDTTRVATVVPVAVSVYVADVNPVADAVIVTVPVVAGKV